MIRTQVQLNEKQFKALKNLSSKEGVSLAELIRRAVDDLVRKNDASVLKEKMLGIAGKFRSGLGDLAEQHDRYFAETKEEK
ncbi:MAG: ribbon-helix-helix domain-containing protein [Bacillota bacterium]